MGFYEFRRQLDYKAPIAGAHVIVADRWFPSSKRCSLCGEKHSGLKLSDRTFVCPTCSFKIDRDINAARNLEMYPDLIAA
jgi:putative transposase